jgi:hypothetical protein
MSKLRYDIHSGVTKAKTRITMGIAALAVALGGGASLTLVGAAHADSTTNTIVTPSSSVYDANHVQGVSGDYAPGFSSGSLKSDGVDKTDTYFTPETLFGHSVTLGEISSMSYWTKKGDTHAVNPADWYLTIYTNPYDGDVSSASWYGDRIGTEPYYSENISDPANTWNNWTTDGSSNKLRFFESTAGAPGATFGSYTDPDWATFVNGSALSNDPYAGHSVQFFSVQTGSAWAAGFEGQVDGLTITLTNGDVANVNFEAVYPVSGSITNPAVDGTHIVSGTVLNLTATYDDGDTTNDDAVQWAVRHGTCAASTGTVAGNVDGYTDVATWDGQNFSYNLDTSGLVVGDTYCFVFNPTDDPGQTNVRLTRTFVIDPALVSPANKDECKKDGWMTFNDPAFKNQGACVSWVEHNVNVHGHDH